MLQSYTQTAKQSDLFSQIRFQIKEQWVVMAFCVTWFRGMLRLSVVIKEFINMHYARV